MKYYLGIDQGGTKTLAAVCREDGTITGVGRAGGNVHYLADSSGVSMKNIACACGDALAGAGVSIRDISGSCAGINGADWDEEYPLFKQKIETTLSTTNVTVVNDCIGAMRAGTNAHDRAVICVGTGMNAAVCVRGKTEIIYGYFVREQDSGGSALGRAAFRAAADAYCGISQRTSLSYLISSHTGFADIKELFTALTTGRFTLEYQHLCPLVCDAAKSGDRAAYEIVGSFCVRAAHYVTSVYEKRGMKNAAPDIVLSGGALKGGGGIMKELISREILRVMPNARVINAQVEPVCGCLMLENDKNVIEFDANIIKSAAAFGLIR